MSTTTNTQNIREKDHYKVLGVSPRATKQEIEQAYSKLASQWHPEKNPNNRVEAQKKFNDISEAYYVLSDPSRRDNYDQLVGSRYSVDDAERTFQRFFSEHENLEDKERDFLDKHYPGRVKSYYEILGVPKNADLQQIREAYRKLALKYHPKNNPGDTLAEKKFTEISEAFTHLSDQQKRANYDAYRFGSVMPQRAHSIFEDFFRNKPSLFEAEKDFFSPLFDTTSSLMPRWARNQGWGSDLFDSSAWNLDWDRDWNNRIGPSTQFAESVKSHVVREKDPQGALTGKTITEKSTFKDGTRTNIRTEEILKPDGTRDVIETIDKNGEVKTSRKTLGPNEEFKQLKN